MSKLLEHSKLLTLSTEDEYRQSLITLPNCNIDKMLGFLESSSFNVLAIQCSVK